LKEQKLNSFLKLGIICFLLTPLAFQFFKIGNFTPLAGVEYDVKNDSVQPTWWNKGYQKIVEDSIRHNFHLRPICVRLKNQWQYSLFGKINSPQIYNYNNVLFRFYMDDYNNGVLYRGMKKVNSDIGAFQKFKLLFPNKPLMIVFAASKMYYNHESLPSSYRIDMDSSNYIVYRDKLKASGLDFIDANAWFLKLKGKTAGPLFTRSAIHWSNLGAQMVVDSLANYMNKKYNSNYDIPKWHLKRKFEILYEDHDLSFILNLKNQPIDFRAKRVEFEKSIPKKKMKVLVISDSFFDVIFRTESIKMNFDSETKYLYYFNSLYSLVQKNRGYDKSKLREDIEKADFVLLISDPMNLENFYWGFTDEVDKLYEEQQ
jgi:hypothetical protein